MDSDGDSPVVDPTSKSPQISPSRSHASKKNQGKVPKRIHKAEREKMKREHLNDLFSDLADALELSEQNNGKASILGEATKLVKDLLTQIEQLKKENASLFSESQYVTMEKKELQDENSILETQISKLQGELKERVSHSNLDLNVAPPEFQHNEMDSHPTENCLGLPALEPTFQHPPFVNPVYVIPFNHSEPQVHAVPGSQQLPSNPTSIVSKPHARYPTPADKWPSQLLKQQSQSAK